MNLQDIKDLMKEFNDSDIYKLSLEMDDVKLKLEKEEPIQQIVAAPSAVMPTPLPQRRQLPLQRYLRLLLANNRRVHL